MDAQDAHVPAPRRPALPRLRRSAGPAELPLLAPDEDTPRNADLCALIADIDALRLTLQTDLTLAAAAVDADAPDLAGELVDGDLREVRAFGVRATDRLRTLGSAGTEAEDAGAPALPRRRILSAAPLMAAAAALIGFVAFVPDRGPASATAETTMTSAALAGYELDRLARAGAPDEALALAAEELNDELARLIARAASDPLAAQQAMLLLESTTEVLARQGDSGVLRSVMAETQALRARLRDALPVTAQRPLRTIRKSATSIASVPLVREQPEKSREAQQSSPRPAASPKPSPKPSPSASPTPEPTPPAAPSSSPTPEPEGSDGPLPQPGDLPGS